jgi:hypothetical protein
LSIDGLLLLHIPIQPPLTHVHTYTYTHLQEFISAYQLIYSGSSDSRLRSLAAEKESFARATRYGLDASGQHIFECYTMPGNEKKGRFKYTLDMPEEGFLKHSSRDLEDRLARAHKVDWEG